MKLSKTQRDLLGMVIGDQDSDFVLRNCVYDRARTGLARIGAIEIDAAGRWRVTESAIEAVANAHAEK